MTQIFIPYVEAPAAWHELRYALRSWYTHAKFNFKIVIVGDKPEWITNVQHIPHTLVRDGQPGEVLRDSVSKITKFLNHLNPNDNFVMTYDDVFILKDTSFAEIGLPKALFDMTTKIPLRNNTWRKHLWRSYDAVRANNCHGYNFETHLPRVFNAAFLSKIIKDYNIGEKQLLLTTVYFNELFKGSSLKPIILSKNDKWKAGFYGQDDEYSFSKNVEIEKVCADKHFLNFNDEGFSPAIQQFLEKKFPKPSIYEK